MMTKAYSGQLRLRMPASLHREISEQADKEGVSLNTYLLYLLAKGIGEAAHCTQVRHRREADILYIGGGKTPYASTSPLMVIDGGLPKQ